MHQDDAFDMTVDEVAYPGKGVGRADGLVTFVPDVLEGEHVRASEVHRYKRHRTARVLTVMTPSPERIEPQCPLAAQCPGCQYQHAAYPHEVGMKQKQLDSMIQRLAGIRDHTSLPPVPASSPLGYRNKIVLHVQSRGDQLVLGYYGEDNQTVLPVDGCPLACPEINAELSAAREDGRLRMRPGQPVTFRHTARDGVVFWNGQPGRKAPWLTDAWLLGEIAVPRGAFFQVHPEMASRVQAAVREKLHAFRPGVVIDLYCGVGIFALLARECGVQTVLGVDSDAEAVKAAIHNAEVMSIRDTTFVAGSARDIIADALEPVDMNQTCVILDPPRGGLHRRVLQALLAAGPAQILYVSCAPDTLCRDLKSLCEGGYRLDSTQLFDMFPRTAHFEVVAGLVRTGSD